MLPNTEVDGILAYDTKDILQRHPTAPTFYRVYGRAGMFAIHIALFACYDLHRLPDDQIMHSVSSCFLRRRPRNI